MLNAGKRRGLAFAVRELGSFSASIVTPQTQKKIRGRKCKHGERQGKPCCCQEQEQRREAEVAPISF